MEKTSQKSNFQILTEEAYKYGTQLTEMQEALLANKDLLTAEYIAKLCDACFVFATTSSMILDQVAKTKGKNVDWSKVSVNDAYIDYLNLLKKEERYI